MFLPPTTHIIWFLHLSELCNTCAHLTVVEKKNPGDLGTGSGGKQASDFSGVENIKEGNLYTISHNLSRNSISEHIANMKRNAGVVARLRACT